MSEVTGFRKAKDDFFRTSPQSPLTPEQKKSFVGLHYFPENPAFRFELPLERYANPERIQMQTSTGTMQEYFKVGQVRFKVNDEEATLQVYEATDNPGAYFVPFVDATAPAESYGAGRYLEPEEHYADELLAQNRNVPISRKVEMSPWWMAGWLFRLMGQTEAPPWMVRRWDI